MERVADVNEERIGTLLVKSAEGTDELTYREPAVMPRVEIVRAGDQVSTGSFRSPYVTLLASLLAFGLLSFAIIVRSGPAIGAISVAVGALAWLVLRGGKRIVTGTRVGIADGELRVVSPEQRLKVPLDEVEGIGIGEDEPFVTLFARLRGRGRVLLMDGLTREEAEAVVARLGDALGRGAA